MKMFSLLAFFALFALHHHDALVRGSETSSTSSLRRFKPVKIPFDALFSDSISNSDDSDPLLRALQEFGMVSITQVPHMKAMKKQALSWDLHLCSQESLATVSHKYPDGTIRRTLTTRNMLGASPHVEHHHATDAYTTSACRKFDDAISPFQTAVDDVTRSFAARLSLLLHDFKDSSTMSLLMTDDNRFPIATVSDVVEYGEHLERFHSYQHLDPSNDAQASFDKVMDEQTMDFHLDQGMFLVLAPGRMTHQDPSQATSLSTGFLVDLPDGKPAIVDFDDEDDLVILLGDGVNQYVNPHLAGRQELRALPHALELPKHSPNDAMVWYGRTVLHPALSVHPEHGKSFAEQRENMIRARTAADRKDVHVRTVSSASTSHMARQLQDVSCESDTLLCTHKCMSLAEYNVTEDVCSSRGQEVFCINPRGQLWDGSYGDFYPGCATSDTETATPYPTLPDYPRDDNICTETSFAEFVSSTPYEHEIDLGAGGAVFLWNVSDGHVHGRMVFNGLLGFLAVGLANVGGALNGMHGANIMMAIPGGNYSAVTGFDLSIDPSIQEYQISPNPDETSFRFWGVEDNAVTAQARQTDSFPVLDLTDCFSSFTFETKSINGVPFNLEGVDQLLWAANDIDSFAGYHMMNRGRFSIDWSSGEAKLNQPAEQPTVAFDNSDKSSASRVRIMLPLLVFLMFWW